MANFGACLVLVSLGVLDLVGGGCELWRPYCFTFVFIVISRVWGCFMGFAVYRMVYALFRWVWMLLCCVAVGFCSFGVGLNFGVCLCDGGGCCVMLRRCCWLLVLAVGLGFGLRVLLAVGGLVC